MFVSNGADTTAVVGLDHDGLRISQSRRGAEAANIEPQGRSGVVATSFPRLEAGARQTVVGCDEH